MFRKILIIAMVIIAIIITASSFATDEKTTKFIFNVFDDKKAQYLSLIDVKKEYNLNDSVETYVFKILNHEKIDCKMFNCDLKTKVLLNDFDKEYINIKHNFCNCQYIKKGSQKKFFFIKQKDILLVKIFTN